MILQKRCMKCRNLSGMTEAECDECEEQTELRIEEIIIKDIICFPNNNVAVCDTEGKQIPFLQSMIKSNMVSK